MLYLQPLLSSDSEETISAIADLVGCVATHQFKHPKTLQACLVLGHDPNQTDIHHF